MVEPRRFSFLVTELRWCSVVGRRGNQEQCKVEILATGITLEWCVRSESASDVGMGRAEVSSEP